MHGDVFEVKHCTDVYCVDTRMYDISEYGSVYLIDAERPALVDTGVGANHEHILNMFEKVGVAREDLAYILVTHVHLDHAGGAGFLAETCPNADVCVHEIGARHLVDPGGLVEGTKRAVGDQWQYYAEPDPVPEERIIELTDGDSVDLGDRTLDVHHAPGHAPHQVILHDDLDDAVFAADAAGIWLPSLQKVYTASPPPNFDLEQAVEDAAMIADLNPEVLLYAHYGPGAADVQGTLVDFQNGLVEWIEAVETKNEEIGEEANVVDYFASRTKAQEAWGTERAKADTAMSVRGALQYLTTEDS